MKNEEYKKLSISEFTKAAGRYESNHAGIYEMCKKDYPDILEELEKELFNDLLDAGCGPAQMISLLSEKYPDRHYTGLDLTPAMIEQAKKKNIPNATFVVGFFSEVTSAFRQFAFFSFKPHRFCEEILAVASKCDACQPAFFRERRRACRIRKMGATKLYHNHSKNLHFRK